MKKYLLIILALSIATHFAFFGHPNETVFDEVHFGKFVSGYYTGEYYFDIHPPLGKLMIAGFAKLFDFRPEYSFANIGDQFPDKKYLVLRFLPTLAGTLLPIVTFLLILELGMSRAAAFTGSLLVVFDNALLTQSRIILLDSFLLLFGFASLLFYFRYRNQAPKNSPQYPKTYSQILKNLRIGFNSNLILMAVFAGLAISIKWTGLSFIALPILIETIRSFKTLEIKTDIKLAIASFMSVLQIASFFVISLVIYFSVFAIHFAFLPKSGPGDAFMKAGFRENNIVKNIWDLNIEMYRSNQRLSATHPYSSSWYKWPFGSKPIFYWVKDSAKIYLQGNPVIWWASTAAVLLLIITLLRNLKFRILNLKLNAPTILLAGYVLNLLPFIGIKRVMFLYHYLTALIFAILILVYLIDKHKKSRKIFTGIIIASIITFLYFAPLTYGL